MGCDIHLYIEYKEKNNSVWRCFAKKIWLGNNYRLFAKLCGVRNEWGIEPISEPRGLPEGVSYAVRNDNTLFICNTEDNCKERCEAGSCSEYCHADLANKWIEMGLSERDGEFRVTHPDWHNHSWVTVSEFESIFKNEDFISAEWKATLAAVKELERLGKDVRIIFWFDN